MGEPDRIYLQAPVGVITVCIRGKVKLRIPATQDNFSATLVDLRFEMLTESVIDANCPSHSLFSLNGWKHLGRVLESDWSFSQRVADGK